MSEILRRVTAAASVTTFFLASVTTFLLASCGSKSSQPAYDAAIQEGQTAAQELINQGASAVAIALVDDKRIIWSQGFGLADRDTGQMPTGMVGHDFFKSYAVTFDFENMQISIRYRGRSLSCMP